MSESAIGWHDATNLDGKTVVLTGGASGIGRVTALQFAQAGATVYMGDRNEAGGAAVAAEAAALPGKIHFLPLDLTDTASIDRFTDAVKEKSDEVDIIASCAGWEKTGPFLSNTPDFWNLVIAINYMGPVRMIHSLLPVMVARSRGKVVMVSSDAGRVGSMGETFYSGAKGAVIAFSKGLAREMARHNIQCNVICPGPTDTPLFHEAMPNPKLKEAIIKAIPLRRLGQPFEVAHGILFLSSPASDFITGQVLSVSGGLTMS